MNVPPAYLQAGTKHPGTENLHRHRVWPSLLSRVEHNQPRDVRLSPPEDHAANVCDHVGLQWSDEEVPPGENPARTARHNSEPKGIARP
jgi:hypothetical protein